MSSSPTAKGPPWKENRNTVTDMIILDDSLRCDEEMGGALGNLRQRMTSGISDEVFGEKSVTPDEATAEKNALRDKVSPKWLVMVRILSQPMSIMIWLAIIIEGASSHYFHVGVLLAIQLFRVWLIRWYGTRSKGVGRTLQPEKKPPATTTCKGDGMYQVVPLLASDSTMPGGDCHHVNHSMHEQDDHLALPGGELEDQTDANISRDTVFVTQSSIADPYKEKGVYTGDLSNSTGMPHGKGRLEYDTKKDRWYDGDWIHGRWTGHGRMSNGYGDYYEGGYKNDRKHGTGVMHFADGRIFEGEYIRDQMIQGKMTYQDGSVYEGCWADGMRHGRGKCIFIDGSKYEGEFEKGHIQGRGQMTWDDGGWYLGEWFEGEMHGNGREIRPDGSLRFEGGNLKGKFHGHGKFEFRNGGWYVGEWFEGERHGNGTEIRPDGSLRHDGEWSRGHQIRSTNTASQPIQPPNTAAQKHSHSHIPDGSEVIRGLLVSLTSV